MTADEVLTESYPATPETVPLARTRVAEFAAAAGARGDCLDAIKLAASEALTNVVVHAYPDDLGQVHVTAAMADGELWLLIGDDGLGLRARTDRPGLGLGLALIAQLCEEFAIARRSSGGTELRMRFLLAESEPAVSGGSGWEASEVQPPSRRTPNNGELGHTPA